MHPLFTLMQHHIQHEENSKNDAADDQRFRQQELGGPEEVDAFQETNKKRRIAERGQRAPDIRDQKDENTTV